MCDDQKRAIEAMLASWDEAWRNGDIDRWGAHFTQDSDFITWKGVWWTSRAENVVGHKDIPPAVSEQMSRYRLTIAGLHLLSSAVALVHARWVWPDFVEAGGPPEDRNGLITLIVVETEDGWRIRALQNTRVVMDS